MCVTARNAKELQVGYLATNGTRTMCYSIHFYINVGVLVPYMTFYDAKPQLVKTPVEGKPSTISTNHTCQCSLLILSYNISPSHFSLHTTFKRCNDYLFPFESHSKKLQSKISLINTLLIRSVVL